MSDLSVEISERLPSKQYARFLTRNETDAEDLVQDCVERAISRQEQFRPGTNLDAWLNTIMRNIFINGKRHIKLVMQHEQRERLTENDSTPPPQMDHVELQQVREAWSKLSRHHRRAIELLCFEQTTYKEVAAEMGISAATAKTRLFRARERLRTQFAEAA